MSFDSLKGRPRLPKLAYTYRDAAEAVGVSIRHLQRAAERGELAVKYAGTKPLIPADELKAWLDSLPSEPVK